jgi:hypothetical protein
VPQVGKFTGAAALVEVDGFGDASSPCKTVVAQFGSSSAMFGRNETRAGSKSSGENIWRLKGYTPQVLKLFSAL